MVMAQQDKTGRSPAAKERLAEEVRVPKTAEIVAEKIRNRIISGDLAEGDSLPSEGQLLEKFGVSRPTLREAFRILENERLISVTRGSRSGARVSAPKVGSVSRYASYYLQASDVRVPDIFEARLAIELHSVRRLCARENTVEVGKLNEEVDRLEALDAAGARHELIQGFTQFHKLLVEVSGNQTLLFMIQMLQELMEQVQIRLLSHHSTAEESDVGKAIRSMRKLVQLISESDAEVAVAHWRLHLINANKRVRFEGTLREILSESA
jgi:DNA-binding FadR family transcriptional regulator